MRIALVYVYLYDGEMYVYCYRHENIILYNGKLFWHAYLCSDIEIKRQNCHFYLE